MTVRANGFARLIRRISALSLLAAAGGLAGFAVSADAQTLPSDALTTCTVPQATFNGWFDAGHPSLNGPVKAADSLGFNPNSNCSFYQWSHQMFLWLTSPAPSAYGGKGRIFNSPVFYDVSNATTVNGKTVRHFIPHVQRPIPFPIGTAKVSMNGLPVVIDRKGKMREVLNAPVAASGRPTIEVAGKPVEIQRIEKAPTGKALFFNAQSKPIAATVALTPRIIPQGLIAPTSRALLMGGEKLATPAARTDFVLARLRKSSVVERFVFKGIPIFIDFGTGAVVDIDPGQAGDHDVLLAQNGSIIFYQTVVNDVFAYFLTGQVHNALPASNQFPTTQPMSTAISTYAATNGVKNKTIVDPEALAIEAKFAWIEVTGSLANPTSYITTQAVIPVYNTSNPTSWTPVSSKVATLALVSVHVVGSVKNHPEMFWATFEHYGNTPLATYKYNNSGGTQTVNPTASGTWLFSSTGNPGSPNVAHATLQSPAFTTIIGANGFNITPSDTIRMQAFGTPNINTQPNPGDPTAAAANTEIISINNNIKAMMTAGGAGADVRNNYYQVGTTWTNGQGPTGPFPSGNEVGTNFLANSAMETYQQGPNPQTGGSNCFSCHGTNTTAVSHMYPVLLPLF